MKLQLQFAELRIDNPCHENWDKMLPEEKGRFCLSCQKTVLDFTQKTTIEILQFFKQRKFATTCVRVNQDVLKKPMLLNAEIINQRRIRKLAWFAYALFIVFGSTLFSCNSKVQDTSPIARTEFVFEKSIPVPDKVNPSEEIKESKFDKKQELTVVGDTTLMFSDVPDTIQLPSVEVKASQTMILGGAISVMRISYCREFIVNDSAELEEKTNIPVKDELTNQLSIFPNPSNGNFQLHYQNSSEKRLQIDAFNQSGQLVREILSEKNMILGSSNVQVDLSDQPAGMYFIRMQTGDTSITRKAIVVH